MLWCQEPISILNYKVKNIFLVLEGNLRYRVIASPLLCEPIKKIFVKSGLNVSLCKSVLVHQFLCRNLAVTVTDHLVLIQRLQTLC